MGNINILATGTPRWDPATIDLVGQEEDEEEERDEEEEEEQGGRRRTRRSRKEGRGRSDEGGPG
eukprot:5790630-Pyramimonas_sp.AAC.1